MQKQCNNCQNVFIKKVNVSLKTWETTKYCSEKCRRIKESINLSERNKQKPTVEKGTIRFNGVQYSKEWCLENPEKVKEFKQERSLIQKNTRREKNKIILEERRLKNPIILKTDKEKKLWQREYRKTHKKELQKYSQSDNSKYRQYSSSAKKRDYEFTLTLEEFTSIFHGKCFYCGQEDCRGIDRVDNLIGYTSLNSKSCCEMCNKMKWKWSKEDFINQVEKIHNNLTT